MPDNITPQSEQAVALRGVRKSYGRVKALDNIDLTIRRGELVSLLGPNGAGKTTAVRLVLGLASADQGTVSVYGHSPRQPENRMRTGAMLQVGKVPETLRVVEHLELFSSYFPAPLPMAEILDRAGLNALRNRNFGELSGGERQRVLFALAICGNPDLLVLDEPTVGLDVETRRSFWHQIQSLVQDGKSILLTTHYLEEADALSNRIVVIDRGAIVAEGSPAEIKNRAAGKRIRCTTVIARSELQSLPGVSSVSDEHGMAVILTNAAETVIRELLARDPSLRDLEVTGAGLEEAFLSLTATETRQEVA